MTTNQYDTIIIGAGQKDLTPSPSPKGEGNRCAKNKAPVFHRDLPASNFQFFDFTEMRVS